MTVVAPISVPFDGWTDEQLHDAVSAWIAAAGTASVSEEVTLYLQTATPRITFFKNLARSSRVIDLGAGEGGFGILRDWPAPVRDDLSLYAVSLERGVYFDRYTGVTLCDFEESLPDLPANEFGAVVCCNFIEHIRNPERCISWISSCLAPSGHVFIEWPHELWKRMPKSCDLAAAGYDVYTSNFYDDRTHVDAWPMARVVDALSVCDMQVQTTGRIMLPWLADGLRDEGIRMNDKSLRTYGLWLRFGLAQYVVAWRT